MKSISVSNRLLLALKLPSKLLGLDFRIHWAIVFALGIVIRMLLFSGYGLGDDPNFFAAYFDIYRSGTFSPTAAYDFRFPFWIPVVLFLKLFGINEPAFIGFITFCSIINLGLVYLLARQDVERRYALLSMALLAVFPLDVLCSTLFVIDIPLSTYCFGAFWLYRQSLRQDLKKKIAIFYAVLSALVLFLAYLTKEWAVLIGILFLSETLRNWRKRWPTALICAASFALMMASYIIWEWLRFGDPLYRIHLVKSVAIFLPYDRNTALDYPQMLLLPNEYRSFFAGFYPHLLFILVVLHARRIRKAGLWLGYFVMLFVLLALAPSHYENGKLMILVPHIFRYLCLISLPLCLALGSYLREVLLWRRKIGWVIIAIFVAISLWQATALTYPTRDAFGEQRRVIAELQKYPDDQVACDVDFGARLMNFAGQNARPDRIVWLRSENAPARWLELLQFQEGILITGGGRLPWYGCHHCTANLDDFQPPPSWHLIKEVEGVSTIYRREPLRIWRVSKTLAEVNEPLSRIQDWNQRLELLKSYVQKAQDTQAREVGKTMLEGPPGPEITEVLFLTGLACLRTSQVQSAQKYFEKGLEHDRNGIRAADFVFHLALCATQRLQHAEAQEWVRYYRTHFPSLPFPEVLEYIESGFEEAITDYHQGRLEKAAQTFALLQDQSQRPADLRQKARYFLPLTLFASQEWDRATKLANEFINQYPATEEAIELRFRIAESYQAQGQIGKARGAFEQIRGQFSKSVWAKYAEERLRTLPAGP